jgi:hypothetical protein
MITIFLLIFISVAKAATNENIITEFLDTSKMPKEVLTDSVLVLNLHKKDFWELYQMSGKKLTHPYSEPGVPIKYSLGKFWHCHNCSVRDIYRSAEGAEIIWDATYHYDQYANRIVPNQSEKEHNNFINLMGCSMAFGFGLKDEQTLSYKLASKLPDNYAHYNSTRVGSGPHTIYHDLVTKPELPYIKEKDNGVFIYIFSEQIHLPRANGFARELAWLQNTHYYEIEDDKLVSHGNFMKARPFISKFYIFVSEIYDRFKALQKLNFPPVLSSHRQVTCRLVDGIRNEIKKRYPNSQFLIYHYPLFGPDSEELIDCFKEHNLTYLAPKHMDLVPKNLIRLSLPHDNHPNQKMTELMSNDLMEHLRQLQIVR